ncbi:PAS domain-containing sensor histidine kinase [Ohtaekwangia koreensis]|uniref:histidine kinase n=1 Tax=Ohtaekwangia koreensis TaxID=688867 RepID=A0A1T5K3W9_9BACT|nr:ATP-binding protein [Ohtaekwangia koreensis]SKC58168.1 two-component system, OmpR family, sensor histidine kinase VicK [Ohtaekwangia koreensis]
MHDSPDYLEIKRIGKLSKDGVFIYKTDDRNFQYLNAAFAEIFDVAHEDIYSQSRLLLALIISEDQHYLQSRFADLLQAGCITSTEFRIRLSNGVLKHVSCDAYVLDNQTTIIGFVKDVSKSKEHENYIINYGAKKDTLLDTITHNLYGPLNLSQSITRKIQESYSDGKYKELSPYVHLIHEITSECIDIVTNFLREEHQESERIFVKKSRFDIIERVRATLSKLVETNHDKNFRLITNLENLYINADSVKFFQTLHNLVSNAIKFTPEGGQIDILLDEAEDSFTICVRDNGIGIPKQLQSTIFNKDAATGRPGLKGEKSIGLGLPIVKNLVELMSGDMWFESEENKGSAFFVKLPKE